MDSSLTALLGAVTGGLIAAGSNWGIEWIRGRRVDELEAVAQSRELREAARLIDDELTGAITTLAVMKLKQRWGHAGQLSTNRWQVYGPILARFHSDRDTWTWLADAYEAIREVNARLQHAPDGDAGRLAPDDADHMSGVIAAIEEGLTRLRKALPEVRS
jgi:hypothetical protein